MSYLIQQGAVATIDRREIKATHVLLKRLFSAFDGHFQVKLWDGEVLELGKKPAALDGTPFKLIFNTPKTILNLIKNNHPLCLAEAYFNGEIDIEGDMFALLKLREQLEGLSLPWLTRCLAFFHLIKSKTPTEPVATHQAVSKTLAPVQSHTREENKQAIAFHYDVSNDFYRLWLDPAMVYSCAYFQSSEQDLQHAQEAKLDLICRKLMLERGDNFLDIGCGWGALVIHAAKYYGVFARGVTLSTQQMLYANHQIALAGLEHCACVYLEDYRDIQGREVFDKIASVGMFEHVGLNNLDTYFATVNRLLTHDGLFLNHGITSDVAGWPSCVGKAFINQYVFPDGQLDTVSNIQLHMERSGFEIADVESMRAHYALTLRHWVRQLTLKHQEALQFVSESSYRVWHCYMTASALSFESGGLGLYQILANKRHHLHAKMPLTRQHLHVSLLRN